MRVVEVAPGQLIFMALGVDYQTFDKWEFYDFVEEKWKPTKSLVAFWANPFPYVVDFETAMKEHIKYLPEDAIVCYSKQGEAFLAVRPKS
jgi:hypothetical protein